jgi:hypothetical protein
MWWYILRVCLRLMVVAAVCAFFAWFAYLSVASPIMEGSSGAIVAGLFSLCAVAAGIGLGVTALNRPHSMKEYTAQELRKARLVLAATRKLRRQKRQRLITIQIDETTTLRLMTPGVRERVRGLWDFLRGREPACDAQYSSGRDDGGAKMDVEMTIWVRYFNGGALAQMWADTTLRHATAPELDALLNRLVTSVDPVGIASLWVTGAGRQSFRAREAFWNYFKLANCDL